MFGYRFVAGIPKLGSQCATLHQRMVDKRITARQCTREHGDNE